MERKPLTREQAEKIAADFQYLVGSLLVPEDQLSAITYIAIAPFDYPNHYGFADYHHLNEGLTEYKYVSPNGEYDVIAIVMEYPNSQLNLCDSIVSICNRMKINYHFP